MSFSCIDFPASFIPTYLFHIIVTRLYLFANVSIYCCVNDKKASIPQIFFFFWQESCGRKSRTKTICLMKKNRHFSTQKLGSLLCLVQLGKAREKLENHLSFVIEKVYSCRFCLPWEEFSLKQFVYTNICLHLLHHFSEKAFFFVKENFHGKCRVFFFPTHSRSSLRLMHFSCFSR